MSTNEPVSPAAAARPRPLLDPKGEVESQRTAFLADLLDGFSRRPRSIPCKWLYDARGSALFERICSLPEYYLTRTELGILLRHGREIAALVGPGARVLEPGSGAGVKSRLLLEHLEAPAGYLAVDISATALAAGCAALERAMPGLDIGGLCADFTQPFELPDSAAARTLVFFPGSTIGNFDPPGAIALLDVLRRAAGADGMLLLGADLLKPAQVLEAAYDDAAGVTAAFNLNLLCRANRELGADFAVERFAHRAVFNRRAGRVEMHLESLCAQRVTIAGRSFGLAKGERIHTESSYKFALEDLQRLAAHAGFETMQVWTDPGAQYAVLLLAASQGSRARPPAARRSDARGR